MNENNGDVALILARASSGKQVIKGDTLEEQIEGARRLIATNKWSEFPQICSIVESASVDERSQFESILKICTDKKNNIRHVVIKNISRFTRQGSPKYFEFKKRLEKANVNLVDCEGVIQPTINKLEYLGFDEYEWGKKSPSEVNEAYEANKAKDFKSDQLFIMLSAEMRYIQGGYWIHHSPYGFLNIKEETNNGKRTILAEHPKEGFFIKKMQIMRASGKYTDKQIVNVVNKLGFKTRIRYKRDKVTRAIIGKTGGKTLTVKQLQRYIKRSIYAGIICEKWTHYEPIVAKFDGLVSIDTFNKSNRGRVFIEKVSSDKAIILYNNKNAKVPDKKRRNKNNPEFPYKNVILCGDCEKCGIHKTVSGSFSTGKLGKKHPYYHHSETNKKSGNKHSFRIKRETMHNVVEHFLKSVAFDSELKKLFEEVFIITWKKKNQEALLENKKAADYIASLMSKQEALIDSISGISGSMKGALQKRYEVLETEIAEARIERNKKEHTNEQIKKYLASALYFVEHPANLLIGESNINRLQQLFTMIFDELPTYEKLYNGTPNLSPLFKLKDFVSLTKSQMVSRVGLEPTTLCLRGRCSNRLSYRPDLFKRLLYHLTQ